MTTIYTIGHGRKSAYDIRAMIDAAGVEKLVDVRTYPSSRRNPAANRAVFEAELGERYVWLGWALGGYKTASVRQHWRNGMRRLVQMAQSSVVAVMCSEGLPEKCHRQLEIVPDLYALLQPGVRIVHIMPDGALRPDRSQETRTEQASLF